MTMEETINKGLLEHAASTAMFCKRCSTVLDTRTTVFATLAVPENGERSFILCGGCFDKIRQELLDLAVTIKGSVEVIDGRELFPSRKRRQAPRPAPRTAQERRDRMVTALTAYDRRQAALAARNPRRSYNRYALPQYLNAVSRIEGLIEGGATVRDAVSQCFCAPLRDLVLKAAGEEIVS